MANKKRRNHEKNIFCNKFGVTNNNYIFAPAKPNGEVAQLVRAQDS